MIARVRAVGNETERLSRDMQKRNYTISGYGEAYGPGKTKTYELIGKGELETFKLGSRTYITAESAEAHRDKLLRAQRDRAAT